MEKSFNSPRDLLNAYRDGFEGSICDPEETAELLSRKLKDTHYLVRLLLDFTVVERANSPYRLSLY